MVVVELFSFLRDRSFRGPPLGDDDREDNDGDDDDDCMLRI